MENKRYSFVENINSLPAAIVEKSCEISKYKPLAGSLGVSRSESLTTGGLVAFWVGCSTGGKIETNETSFGLEPVT